MIGDVSHRDQATWTRVLLGPTKQTSAQFFPVFQDCFVSPTSFALVDRFTRGASQQPSFPIAHSVTLQAHSASRKDLIKIAGAQLHGAGARGAAAATSQTSSGSG